MRKYVLRWMKRRIDAGVANCLIFALYMHYEHGWNIVLRRTTHNKIRWIVWWHALAKPPVCPLAGGCCAGEKSFVPIDYKDRILPPPLFRGRVKSEVPDESDQP